jgi:hypothetical protein
MQCFKTTHQFFEYGWYFYAKRGFDRGKGDSQILAFAIVEAIAASAAVTFAVACAIAQCCDPPFEIWPRRIGKGIGYQGQLFGPTANAHAN